MSARTRRTTNQDRAPMLTKQERLNVVFSALSDPTRRKILERLSIQPEVPVSDLAKPFQMSLPAISRHLRVLEEAKLVSRRREGRTHNIRVNEKGLKDAQKWIMRYAEAWEGRFGAMEQLLNKNKKKDRR